MTAELQHAVEQFYYREARLLDERCYQDWLALCDPAISYSMPARGNPLVDNRAVGEQDMISVARELEDLDSDGCPLRDENIIHLMLRVERAYKRNSWAENPPARTRRVIGNVEILSADEEALEVLSNFMLSYARPGSDNFQYAGQRRDRLLRRDDGFAILSREVVLDIADIQFPTVGLFF